MLLRLLKITLVTNYHLLMKAMNIISLHLPSPLGRTSPRLEGAGKTAPQVPGPEEQRRVQIRFLTGLLRQCCVLQFPSFWTPILCKPNLKYWIISPNPHLTSI